MPRSRSSSTSSARPASLYRTSDGTFVVATRSDDPAKGRFVVVNPMHIVTLSRRSWGVRMAQKLHIASQKWFTHVILLFILVLYCVFGALLFRWIEGPHEAKNKASLRAVRLMTVDTLYRDFATTPWSANFSLIELRWKDLAVRRLLAYETQVQIMYDQGISSTSDRNLWTFWGSMFYCGTVFTTIGYGNIAPSTTAGRALTIAYASMGIPLLLMVLADLGKLFTRLIKVAFRWLRRCYEADNVRLIRQVSVRAYRRAPTKMFLPWVAHLNREEDSDQNRKSSGDHIETQQASKEQQQQEDPHIPIYLVLLFLFAYMGLGTVLFSFFQNWTIFESFYFVFVSMSTIGFGDYVPDHPIFMMATFVYLLFGLALTSMCINVIQEKLSSTFHKAKMHIGLSLGLQGGAHAAAIQTLPTIIEIDDDQEQDSNLENSVPRRRYSSIVAV